MCAELKGSHQKAASVIVHVNGLVSSSKAIKTFSLPTAKFPSQRGYQDLHDSTGSLLAIGISGSMYKVSKMLTGWWSGIFYF